MKLIVLGVLCIVFLGISLVCIGCIFGGKRAADEITRLEDERKQDVTYVEQKKADMTVGQFLANRPEEPKTVRAKADLGNIWMFAFRGSQKTHYNIHISGSDNNADAYVDKESPDGKRLYEMTKNGNNPWVTLRIQRAGPDGGPIPPQDEAILILKVIEGQ